MARSVKVKQGWAWATILFVYFWQNSVFMATQLVAARIQGVARHARLIVSGNAWPMPKMAVPIGIVDWVCETKDSLPRVVADKRMLLFAPTMACCCPQYVGVSSSLSSITREEWSWTQGLCVGFRLAYWAALLFPVIAWSPVLFLGGPFADLWWAHMLWSLQQCGVVMTKLGQWAACRPDLLPTGACKRLELLQRQARTHNWDASERALRASGLWDTVEAVDREPIGSGVTAQVHRARLRVDGRRVAIKIAHPDLRARLETDLRALWELATGVEKLAPSIMRWYAPSAAVAEFGQNLRRSASMAAEANALQRMRKSAPTGVRVPEPIRATEDVLIESFEDGIALAELTLDGQQAKTAIAKRGLRCLLRMLFVDNFAHADMHAGNLLVRVDPAADDNFELVLLDAGLVVQLGPVDRENFVDLFAAVVARDDHRVGALLYERSPDAASCPNPDAFIGDVASLVHRATAANKLTLAQLGVARLITELFVLCYKHKVRLDSGFVNVVLAVAIVEGLGRQLDPDLDLLSEAIPFVRAAALDVARAKLLGTHATSARSQLE